MAEAANRSLLRGLQLLELLSEHPEGLELHEACKALELPKSSGHNLLQQLVQSRYVRVSPHGKYRLTLKAFEVGATAVHATEMTQVLRQYMQEVFAACNETMHCGVRNGREVLYIDKIESTQSIRMASHVGIRMPLYATAMGKAFLAAMTDAEVRALYAGRELPPLTDRTITHMEPLLRQLEEIRQCGYAVEDQENTVNVSCIGVAVLDRDGKPAYALSISAPSFRVTEDEIASWSKLLLRAKKRIERVLKAM